VCPQAPKQGSKVYSLARCRIFVTQTVLIKCFVQFDATFLGQTIARDKSSLKSIGSTISYTYQYKSHTPNTWKLWILQHLLTHSPVHCLRIYKPKAIKIFLPIKPSLIVLCSYHCSSSSSAYVCEQLSAPLWFSEYTSNPLHNLSYVLVDSLSG